MKKTIRIAAFHFHRVKHIRVSLSGYTESNKQNQYHYKSGQDGDRRNPSFDGKRRDFHNQLHIFA